MLAALVLTIYSNTLKSPFLFDDFPNIIKNHAIQFKDLSFDSLLGLTQNSFSGISRILAYLSFGLNYYWGGFNLLGYHLVNILIHLSCGLLAALFFFQLLGAPWLPGRYAALRGALSWAAAFIWAAHPIQINAVTYIVQRMTSLAAFFALLALVAWLAGRARWGRQAPAKAWLFWIGSAVSWGLGMLCKEQVAVLPLLIVVLELFWFRRGDFSVRPAWVVGALLFGVGIALVFLGRNPWATLSATYTFRAFNPLERLMTESRVLWHYLGLFFYPVADRFSLIYDYPLSRGLLHPATTLLSIGGWLCAMVLAWFYRRKWPLFATVTAWFLVSHLIESTVIPLEIIYEHRMYIPSLLLSFGFVLAVDELRTKFNISVKVSVALLAAFVVLSAAATYIRNMDYREAVSFYRNELVKFPHSKRIKINLALTLIHSGFPQEGESVLRELYKAYPDDILVMQNLHANLIGKENASELRKQLEDRILRFVQDRRFDTRLEAESAWNLAQYFYEVGEYRKSLVILDELLVSFDAAKLWTFKGRCLAALGDFEGAEAGFGEALKRAPNDPESLFWYGTFLLQSGAKDKGCRVLQACANQRMDQYYARLSAERSAQMCAAGQKKE